MMTRHSHRLGAVARTACATVALLALSGSVSDGPDAASADIMSHIGEIALVGFNFAPNGWVPADGRSLPIAENEALFGLIGTTYGGDGSSTFNVPKIDAPAQGMIYVIALFGVYPSP
jgi:microcystin-dependent protein